jgi:hypothetical protein
MGEFYAFYCMFCQFMGFISGFYQSKGGAGAVKKGSLGRNLLGKTPHARRLTDEHERKSLLC